MAILTSNYDDMEVFSFLPSFEGIHALLAELCVYVFDADGELLEYQSIQRGKAVIALGEHELRSAQVFVAPVMDEADLYALTLHRLRRSHAFEAHIAFEPGKRSYQLERIPETTWRWWLVHCLWDKMKHKSNTNVVPRYI